MHVADMSIGMLGANGIVGAGIFIACGSALAHQLAGRNAVAVAFFGDGALAEGVLHESLNIASLWKLPILFVCENNGWSEFSPGATQFKAAFPTLARAFDIESREVDGNNVQAVADVARVLIERLRSGGGPAALECVTHRHRGHYEGDAQSYRDPAEIENMQRADPLQATARALIQSGVAQSWIDSVDRAAHDAVEAATAQAIRS